jgi:hypothetical protein
MSRFFNQAVEGRDRIGSSAWRTHSVPSSAWARKSAKLCFASLEAELGNEAVEGVIRAQFVVLIEDYFMRCRSARGYVLISLGLVTLALLIAGLAADRAAAESRKATTTGEKKFMHEVSGEFDVKVSPVDTGDAKLGMLTLDKTYHGDLDATGAGRMLTGMTDVKGSAAYVAMERVSGKLKGATGTILAGTFLLSHSGVMNKGTQSMSIRVVPDSGTGELADIDGELHIKIADGKHFYRFEFSLGDAK